MSGDNMNNKVAKELSDAMARCKQQGVDEPSLRTGLLTITIANFINRIGMGNTLALFEALPEQITSGIFDRYIDPTTNTPRSYNPAPPSYPQPQQHPQQVAYAPPPQQQAMAPMSAPPQPMSQPMQQNYLPQDPAAYPYQNSALPQSFVPPYPGHGYGQVPLTPAGQEQQRRRRLSE